jgi:hypothetical protein
MPRNAVSRVSRAEYLAGSLSQLKPWEALGVSRRTWYRLGGPKPDGTSVDGTSMQTPAGTSMSAAQVSPGDGRSVDGTSPAIPVSLPGGQNPVAQVHRLSEPMSQVRWENFLGELAWLADEFRWPPEDLSSLESFCSGETVRSIGPEHAVTASGRAYDRITGGEWVNPCPHNVSDAGQSPVTGSVTVFNTTYNSMTAGVRLSGAAPNTTYRVFIKCGKQLGAFRTDAEGNGGRTFNYLTDALSPAYGFEIVPDGAEAREIAEPQSQEMTAFLAATGPLRPIHSVIQEKLGTSRGV